MNTQELAALVEDPDTTPEELQAVTEELEHRLGECLEKDDAMQLVTLARKLVKRLDFETKANEVEAHDAANLETIDCESCGQSWSFQEPEPLTRDCAHGSMPGRDFASCARMQVYPDGRVKLQLDLRQPMLPSTCHAMILLSHADAERFRKAMRDPGPGMMVKPWES